MEILHSLLFYRLAVAIFAPLAVLCSLFFLITSRRHRQDDGKGGSGVG